MLLFPSAEAYSKLFQNYVNYFIRSKSSSHIPVRYVLVLYIAFLLLLGIYPLLSLFILVFQVYSNTVPLEKSVIDFATSERGTKSVGTVLVLYTGGAIGMHEKDGVYKPKQHLLTNYLMKMPIFNDAR